MGGDLGDPYLVLHAHRRSGSGRDELSQQVADEASMEQAARHMSRLHETDPDAWNDYLSEGEVWEVRTVEPVEA